MLLTLRQPAGLPLSVDLARAQVKQDITDDDLLLTAYIGAAADYAEAQIQRSLLVTRFCYQMDAFPGPSLFGVPPGEPFTIPGHAALLPRTPLRKMEAINYLDMGGAWQTMPPSDYVVDDGAITRITPCFGKIWPIPLPQLGAVKLTFLAGYATSILDVQTSALTFDLWGALQVGDPVRLSNSGGALPAPLKPKRDYYVASIDGNTLTVSDAPGGQAIQLADAGTGQHYLGEIPEGIIAWMLLRIDSLYAHRGEVAIIQGRMEPLPYVDRLLDPFRSPEY